MIQHRAKAFLALVAFLAFAHLFFPARADASTDEFLKFHWAFDEGSGTVANDSSGNTPSYPGTLYNYDTPAWISGGGLSFDGESNQFVRTDDPIPESMGVTDQAYTLSASVRLPDADESGNIIHISNGGDGIGWCIAMLHVEDGHFRAIGWDDGEVAAVDPSEATPGQWYSIANTWSPDTKEMDLYVDGDLVASSSMEHYTAADQDVYVFAGIDPGGCADNHGPFKGDIKDVRIYSRAISHAEAQTNSDNSIVAGPHVVTYSPAQDAAGISTSADLVATFSTSTMATSSGSVDIRKTADDSLVESIPVSSPQVSISGAVVTIHPGLPLDGDTGYYVSIPGTAFVDGSTTPYAGTAASSTWSFTTEGFTPPSVTIQAASSVATSSAVLNATIVSEGTASTTNFGFEYGTSTSYGATISFGTQGIGAYYDTVSGLAPGTLYHARAFATNPGGTASSSDVTFVTPFSVALLAPGSGMAYYGTVTLSATTTDAVSLAGFTYYVDGVQQGSEVTSAPYQYVWDSTATTSGSHSAFAVARTSTGGYSTSTAVNFSIFNTGIASRNSVGSAHGATITWVTGVNSSTEVQYGLTSGYGSTTPEADTSPRTMDHSISFSGLASCSAYHYMAISRTAIGETSTTSDSILYTAGCTGDAYVGTSTEAFASGTSPVSISNGAAALEVPPGFAATSSSAEFEILQMDPSAFFAAAGTPPGLTRAGSSAVHMTALTDNLNKLGSFLASPLIVFSYSPSDIAGLDESSLGIYQYDGTSWTRLSGCEVDAADRQVACLAGSLSDFALFGSPRPAAVAVTTGPTASSISTGYFSSARLSPVAASSTAPAAAVHAYQFPRNLKKGASGDDVVKLQQFLNAHGSVLAQGGAGSPGHETGLFSMRTERALMNFQAAHAPDILKPQGLEKPTGWFYSYTRAFVNAMLAGGK